MVQADGHHEGKAERSTVGERGENTTRHRPLNRFSRDLGAITSARRWCLSMLPERDDWVRSRQSDIAQCITELVVNAVSYGTGPRILARAVYTPEERFDLTVASAGPMRSSELWPQQPTDTAMPSGRGLVIASAMSDELALVSRPNSVSVTATFVRRVPESL